MTLFRANQHYTIFLYRGVAHTLLVMYSSPMPQFRGEWENKMNKLLNAFRAEPSEANRAKLAKYLQKHMMALCLASPDEIAFLKSHGFAV